MDEKVLLSLCIPTNGVCEWVGPVINSIYAEKSPVGAFEVIITDNGKNVDFEKLMNCYVKRFDNLIYKKTEALQFQNQIEAFKLARGTLIKFINHRMMLLPGTLNYLIEYAKTNKKDQPTTFFSNGVLKNLPESSDYNTFDSYVRALSFYSSWSAGTAMWKTEFKKLDTGKMFNQYFPHIDMVFLNKTGNKYKIVNKKLTDEIRVDDTKKGKYDLFDAFAHEYVKVLDELKQDNYITDETFEIIRKANERFVANLYYTYVFSKKPCSYELNGFEKAISFYYKKSDIYLQIPGYIIRGLMGKARKIYSKG